MLERGKEAAYHSASADRVCMRLPNTLVKTGKFRCSHAAKGPVVKSCLREYQTEVTYRFQNFQSTGRFHFISIRVNSYYEFEISMRR